MSVIIIKHFSENDIFSAFLMFFSCFSYNVVSFLPVLQPCVRRNCFEDDRMCFKDVGRTCVGGDENEEKMWWMMTVVNDDEEEKATYNYSIFHFLMFISVLYLMMHLTNWA